MQSEEKTKTSKIPVFVGHFTKFQVKGGKVPHLIKVI